MMNANMPSYKTGKRTNILSYVMGKYGLYILLIVTLVLASLVSGDFLSYLNITNLLSQISIVGILAIAQMIVILTAGIDLSQGSYIAVGSVILSSSMILGVPASLAITFLSLIVCGLFNGFFVNRGIHPFIVTLGMMGIARTLALVIANGETVLVPVASFSNIAYTMLGPIPLPFAIFFVLFLVFGFFLKYHPTGRHIYAVGGNEEAARLSGVNVKKIKYLVYILSGFLSAFAVIIYTAKLGTALPDKAVGYEFHSIAAAIIGGASLFGGIGTMTGTFVGVIVYGVITNVLNLMGISPYLQQVVEGAIIIGAVYMNTRGKWKEER
jgi:inositol transport system permease protein